MKKVNFIARQNGGLLFDRKFSATELYIISTVRQRRLYESFAGAVNACMLWKQERTRDRTEKRRLRERGREREKE